MRTGMVSRLINYIKSLSSESVRYIIAGVLTTLVNFLVFALLRRALLLDVNSSNITAIAGSILFAYFANKFYVFKNCCRTITELLLEFIKFVGSRLFTMALEVGIVFLFVTVLRRSEMPVKLAAQVVVVIANYIISKLIVFRNSPGKPVVSDE